MTTPAPPPDNLPPSNQLHAYEQFVDEFWTGGSPEYTMIAFVGEVGEAFNLRKKGMRAPGLGHDPNWKPKLKKELGDALYYFVRMCHDHGTTLEAVMLANEKKLRARGYGKTSSPNSPG